MSATADLTIRPLYSQFIQQKSSFTAGADLGEEERWPGLSRPPLNPQFCGPNFPRQRHSAAQCRQNPPPPPFTKIMDSHLNTVIPPDGHLLFTVILLDGHPHCTIGKIVPI